MIAKRITTKAATPRVARLVKYVVAAQGGIDPRSWSRTADYVLNSGTSSRGEKVGGVRVTNCNTDDPAAATTLIECTQAANTRSKTDKTYHLVFSFPPGEEPTLDVMHKIENDLVASIGYSDHQRISAVHVDCDHLHVHVAINKVHPKGFQNIEPYFDKKKLMEACERLEIQFGLQRTNHGLTGEKRHERSKEIKLSPNHQLGIHSHDGIYQSDILTATPGYEGEHYDGMPELPGGNVACIERGYSELLPGNARNRVLRQREEQPESMRWKGLGADSSRSKGDGRSGNRSTGGLMGKAAEAEAHSGIETLVGYVTREVAPTMREAANWKELHAALAKHGLQIKPRGAGLVIGNETLWVRASQCDRAFSMKGLTDRLGPFKAAGKTKAEKAEPYQPKPRQEHPSSAVLFDQYQRQQMKHKAVRSYGLEQVKYEGAVMEANLQRWKLAQKRLVKLAAKGPSRRAMLKVVKLQTDITRKSNWKKLDAMRRKVAAETSFPTWAMWLTQQSANGDTEALGVLRSRAANGVMQGDVLTAAKHEKAENIVIAQLNPSADGKGSLSYKTMDGGLIIDRKTHVQSFRTTAGSSLMALELAAQRFKGQPLIVEGNPAFQKEVVRLAGIHGLDVRFADPAMEKSRKATAPLYVRPTKNKQVEL